jgi:hypothetical protein
MLRKHQRLIIVFLCMITLCSEGGKDKNLQALEGTYSYSFTNGLVNGQKYVSRNQLQLVQVTSSAAYFNVHLAWANGHVCNISGVAQVEGNDAELVYRKPSLEGKTCKLTINSQRDGIELGDEAGACRLISCGKIQADTVRQSQDFVRAWHEYEHQDQKH